MTINPIQPSDNYGLESLTIVSPNKFKVLYDLQKTYHGKIFSTASCIRTPEVKLLTQLDNNLAISYSTQDDLVDAIWLKSTDTNTAGYGYATGQCRVRGVDYISLPNDQYAELVSYVVSNQLLKTNDFLNLQDAKTVIEIFRSFRK